jgi:hypothetical protein
VLDGGTHDDRDRRQGVALEAHGGATIPLANREDARGRRTERAVDGSRGRDRRQRSSGGESARGRARRYGNRCRQGIFAKTLGAGEVAGQTLDVFIAGDDEAAKQTVATLAESGGLRPFDVGPLRRARQLEQLMFLNITIQEPLGLGYQSTIKVLP